MTEVIFSLAATVLLVTVVLFLSRRRIKKIPKYWTNYDENIYS